ncbi:MAG: hypothetical protein A2821_04690 [Candidatus Magasanikbacteria bacterium RIFCSPHIGHO2_01_FULL_41_23]|uniref:Uncharacterized protein n=1 Tax=Candidatus Magasanikbacteria bacterium RIFCSPLOWO2_01_FULL_40_15 TaxID=1798686 RepID=A0A1F6N4E8_9BACT|nr:MAG: hypothetical protein A2821_04690 [Candidatus Magasanikbacteria bacterium RIFCSPHIGHO2_01_FULL_41_23]OGH67217.1 MAG: hypothetical protein A3C66_03000 [Candidatus Magasanikbacteria bacterium RIFCSPHIGHO2_02_FULL_41_35]OGH78752.1 MAG: hypothetical protein A2983_04640 [Candidatus Magasanikbacteria bacterium RIFCSPLOWO2_01_FULL_40_15]
MIAVGATFYVNEPWHFNFGSAAENTKYQGAGGGCHSLLKNVRSDDGEYVAVWGNADAHRMARELLGS